MKTALKLTTSFVALLALIGAVVSYAPLATRVYAETETEIQARIVELTAQLAALKTVLLPPMLGKNTTTVNDVPITFRFTRTLSVGARGVEVKYLQTVLNRDTATEVAASGVLGGKGQETEHFGSATKRAVMRFQNKYASEVLAPAGLTSGTGGVGTRTRAKLNALWDKALQRKR